MVAILSVHGIGRRPAMALVASNEIDIEFENTKSDDDDGDETNMNGGMILHFPEMALSWNASASNSSSEEQPSLIYPEYLVTLKLLRKCHDNNNHATPFLTRSMHVLPPPSVPLTYKLHDIVWSPGLFPRRDEIINRVMDDIVVQRRKQLVIASENSNDDNCKLNDNDHDQQRYGRRRGFGLELETVQMPPDYESGCFTHAQVCIAGDIYIIILLQKERC